jgi:hypothetical protein
VQASCVHAIIHQIAMSSVLQLALQERAAQRAEAERPPFTSAEALRAFITERAPVKYENVVVEMCVLSMEQRDQTWRLELIDKDLETEFDALSGALEELSFARRNKFIFQLTLWKSNNPFYDDIPCCRGWTFRFEKVHALNLRYGNPTGSLQLRKDTHISRVRCVAPGAALPTCSGTGSAPMNGETDAVGSSLVTTPSVALLGANKPEGDAVHCNTSTVFASDPEVAEVNATAAPTSTAVRAENCNNQTIERAGTITACSSATTADNINLKAPIPAANDPVLDATAPPPVESTVPMHPSALTACIDDTALPTSHNPPSTLSSPTNATVGSPISCDRDPVKASNEQAILSPSGRRRGLAAQMPKRKGRASDPHIREDGAKRARIPNM